MELGALRPVGFFTWNARSFSERWARRAGMAGMAVARPFAYATSRTFATRFLHLLLRGVSRDRLDLLGEEYFHYVLKPQLRQGAVEEIVAAVRQGERVVLVGQLLENILRPLAHHLGAEAFQGDGSLAGSRGAPAGTFGAAGQPSGGWKNSSRKALEPAWLDGKTGFFGRRHPADGPAEVFD